MTDNQPTMTEAEIQQKALEWNRAQFVEAQRYCSKNQFNVKEFVQNESRTLPPVLALWKVKLKDADVKSVWIISGEVPTDHVATTAAATAREAIRHFSMKWQLKAEQLRGEAQGNPTKESYVNKLVQSAEGIYPFYENDQLWQYD